MKMVGILKIQVGRLWVFSRFFLFEMGFEGLFMWGVVCTEAEFLLIQFPKHLGVFFSHKHNEWGGGGELEKEKCKFFYCNL
jgi:hypothetical protein